jgi:hypothetical protein
VPATTTTLDPEHQVIAAYQNYARQYQRVTDDPNGNPADAQLLATMTSSWAKYIESGISELRSAHEYTKGGLIVHPQKVVVAGAEATLLTCNRDDGDLYDEAGRNISAHQGVGTPEVLRATLTLSPSGGWLVDQNISTGAQCTI